MENIKNFFRAVKRRAVTFFNRVKDIAEEATAELKADLKAKNYIKFGLHLSSAISGACLTAAVPLLMGHFATIVGGIGIVTTLADQGEDTFKRIILASALLIAGLTYNYMVNLALVYIATIPVFSAAITAFCIVWLVALFAQPLFAIADMYEYRAEEVGTPTPIHAVA